MRAYTAVLCAALVTSGLAATAEAAPKKPRTVCNLVKDPTGDVSNKLQGVDVFPSDPGLDLVGGDVATGAKTVSAIVRLAAEPEASPAYVSRYIVDFSVAGLPNKVVLAAGVGLDATTYHYGYYAQDPTTGNWTYSYTGTATGALEGKNLRITAQLADLAGNTNIGAIKKNAKISNIVVSTKRRLPPLTGSPRGQLVDADLATTKTAYLAGQPSCVKPS